MSMLLSLFLLFYSLCGLEARAQEIEAAANDLEAVFRLEDDLEARPFLLETGERYRDLLTMTAARNVAEFGIIRSQEESRPLKSRWSLNRTASFHSRHFIHCQLCITFISEDIQ